MVPVDEEAPGITGRIAELRSPGRPLPHPRTGRLAGFLLTHQGRRVSMAALRTGLHRAAAEAGISPAAPHQLRHACATRPGQPGGVAAGADGAARPCPSGDEPALRPAARRHRPRGIRAGSHPGQGPARPGPVLPGRALPPADVTGGRRQDTPLIKSRLAGGYCPRTAAQGPCACACACASICEHCPNFRNDPAFLPILAAQRADAETLAADARHRGRDAEAARHRNLIERPDLLISRAQAS